MIDDEKKERSSGHESSTYPSRVDAFAIQNVKRINRVDIVRRF